MQERITRAQKMFAHVEEQKPDQPGGPDYYRDHRYVWNADVKQEELLHQVS